MYFKNNANSENIKKTDSTSRIIPLIPSKDRKNCFELPVYQKDLLTKKLRRALILETIKTRIEKPGLYIGLTSIMLFNNYKLVPYLDTNLFLISFVLGGAMYLAKILPLPIKIKANVAEALSANYSTKEELKDILEKILIYAKKPLIYLEIFKEMNVYLQKNRNKYLEQDIEKMSYALSIVNDWLDVNIETVDYMHNMSNIDSNLSTFLNIQLNKFNIMRSFFSSKKWLLNLYLFIKMKQISQNELTEFHDLVYQNMEKMHESIDVILFKILDQYGFSEEIVDYLTAINWKMNKNKYKANLSQLKLQSYLSLFLKRIKQFRIN